MFIAKNHSIDTVLHILMLIFFANRIIIINSLFFYNNSKGHRFPQTRSPQMDSLFSLAIYPDFPNPPKIEKNNQKIIPWMIHPITQTPTARSVLL